MKMAPKFFTAALLLGTIIAGPLFARANQDGTASGGETPLVSVIDDLNGKFSPFSGQSAYDMLISEQALGDGLVGYDRVGNLVYQGIQGETRSFNGSNYRYDGIADVTVTRNAAADTTTYNFKLRPGVRFSDGQTMDADDVIFSLYVFCDPSYVGSSTVSSLAIQGLNAYRTKTSDEVYAKYQAMAQAILAAGPGNPRAGSGFSREQYTAFYGFYAQSWKNYAQKIVDYCVNNYPGEAAGLTSTPLSNTGVQVALGMNLWSFANLDEATGDLVSASGKRWNLKDSFPTAEDYYQEFVKVYETLEAFCDVELIADTDDPIGDAVNAFISESGKNDPGMAGITIDSITGIRKISQSEVEVVIDGINAAAIYRLALQPAPLHYYGNEALYNYDRHQFGFPFGDLSGIYAKDNAPMGAGPYKFVRFENRVVYLEANEYYWRGVPKTKYLQFKITLDADKIPAIITGAADISDPSNSKERMTEIAGFNSNKQVTGDVITYHAVDFLGYGYIGLNAQNISVGGSPGSDASKNLRRGIATVLAAYRDLTVDSFYGDAASVINYPMSSTSWAAPRNTDPGYRVAYSRDVRGNEIYTASMNADQRYAAATQAALGFLEAAGYALNAARTAVTVAPAGASLSYEVMIGGAADHPSFLLLTSARESLATIGISLNVNSVEWSVLNNAMSGGTAQIWVAAWGASLDPDMYQVYHSSNVVGRGGSSNMYMIADPQLDRYIEEARNSLDNTYRREIFRSALETIMDWGVEVPVYQRQDCNLFSTQRIKIDTLPKDMTTYWSWIREVYNIEMK
jgi:peptide/nickel transport system substrate-binding protein